MGSFSYMKPSALTRGVAKLVSVSVVGVFVQRTKACFGLPQGTLRVDF